MTFLAAMGIIGACCFGMMVFFGAIIEYAHHNQGDE